MERDTYGKGLVEERGYIEQSGLLIVQRVASGISTLLFI